MPEQPTIINTDTVVQVNQPNHEEKRMLLSWEAPSRPFKKRDKDFYTTVITISVLSAVILFFLSEFLVILVVFAFVFLVFVLSSVPPENITHEIYNTGIKTGDHFHPWGDLVFYRFEARWGYDLLYVRTLDRFPGALYLLLGTTPKEKVEAAIGTSLVKRDDIDNTWMDQAADWISQKVPLEKQ